MTPHALLDALEARLTAAPPPGVSSAYAAGFFARRRGQLLLHLRAALRRPVASEERIITLNMGLGRDSLAMLALLIEGQLVAEGRPLRPADVDAVVFSDPGFEWAHLRALSSGAADVRAAWPAADRAPEARPRRRRGLPSPAPAAG